MRKIAIFILALLVYQVFNYSITAYALDDIIGNSSIWPTILAIFFCGLDFSGIARMFAQDTDEPFVIWYMFAAYLLLAAANATLVWWGVSVAVSKNATIGGDIGRIVPIFVAVVSLTVRVVITSVLLVIPSTRPTPRAVDKSGRKPIRMPLPSK